MSEMQNINVYGVVGAGKDRALPLEGDGKVKRKGLK